MDRTLRYAEDLVVGEAFDLGEIALSRSDIVDFATLWDPQPFHVADAAVDEHYFGGVVASGAHTIAVFQRLAVLGAYASWAVMAGKALHEVLFLQPVRPGDRLRGSLHVVAIEMTDPRRALVTQRGRLTVSGQSVFEMSVDAYVYRRP